MAGQLLLINPRKRAKRKAAPRKRARARRRNPLPALAANPRRRVARRATNPANRRRFRSRVMRRRNPISGGSIGKLAMGMVKEAAIGGVGAVIIDVGMGQVKSRLPVSMQTGYTYDLVKGALTIAAGIFGRKLIGPSAITMATGALTSQIADQLYTMASDGGMTMGRSRGMGYFTPGTPVRGGAGNPVLPQYNGKGMSGARRGGSGVGMFMPRGGVGSGTLGEMAGARVFR